MSNIKIADIDQRIQYTATTAQTQFTVPFPFFANDELVVWQNGVALVEGAGAGQYGLTGAGSPSGGLVTLVTGATVSDIITIEGDLPIDRTSIYSATISNLTGSDLNSDFNREVVMMKQLETNQELLQLSYAPWVEVSQDVTVTKDRRIPILAASQIWGKDSGDTAIVAIDIPTSGTFAPGDSKFLIQTADIGLPNAQVMGALSSGLVVNTTTTGVQLTREIAGSTTIGVTNGNGIAGNPTIAISPTYPGQSTISTLGTITTGVWSATTIAANKGGTGQTTYLTGDILYSNATNSLTKLPGNTSATKNFLAQTGTGAVSQAPAWTVLAGTDISGAALTGTNDTNVTITLAGNDSTALLRTASITLGWQSQLAVARGGTGLSTTPATGKLLTGNGSGYTLSNLVAGSNITIDDTSTPGQITITASSGSGDVSAGAQYALGYYATAGTTISGFSMNSYSVLLADTGGVPTSSSPLLDGEIIIGATGAIPSAGSIVGGSGITVTPSAGGISIAATGTASPLTTKGDLYTYDTGDQRLAVGTTDGQILQVDSAQATGLKYSTATYPATAPASLYESLISNGTNWVSTEDRSFAAQDYFNALMIGSPSVVVSSDGATITLTLDNNPTGNINILTSTGIVTFTAPANVALTPGTDAAPILNYVYVLKSNNTLTVSTSAWPTAEYAAVATVLCQTAASAAIDGVYKVHQWTDHMVNSISNGHSSDINYWIRSQNATWTSGASLTPTPLSGAGAGAAGVFTVAIATGVILQLHEHAFPAFDTSTGSHAYVPNDSVTAYDKITDLATLLTDANGVSMSNKRFNLVIWGVVSEDSGDCQLFVNLPTASYNNNTDAINDTDRTAVYNIPVIFKGTGFLISRLSMRHVASGNTWETLQNEDLRGLLAATATGSGTGGITQIIQDTNPILGNNLGLGAFCIKDLIACDAADTTKQFEIDLSGATTSTKATLVSSQTAARTYTLQDGSGTLAFLSDVAGGVLTVNQTMHGFAVNDVIRLSGVSTYTKAQADTAANAEVVGIVTAVAGANDFTVQQSGHVTGLTALTANTVYFLSEATPGLLTATPPTTLGEISKPVLVTDTTTSAWILPYRGNEIEIPSGSVNTGNQNEVAYYSATGDTVSGFALNNSSMLTTTSAGALASTATLTNGQIVVGSTGATPTPATLTAGTGIGIANGAASITISAANTPYDIAFIAGFDSAAVKENVVVQSYGQLVMARTGSFTGESGYADTAPTDAALIVDIEKNGVTIYTTKPEFASTSQTLSAGTLKADGTEDFVAGDRITFKITQIGSTLPGQGIRFTLTGEV